MIISSHCKKCFIKYLFQSWACPWGRLLQSQPVKPHITLSNWIHKILFGNFVLRFHWHILQKLNSNWLFYPCHLDSEFSIRIQKYTYNSVILENAVYREGNGTDYINDARHERPESKKLTVESVPGSRSVGVDEIKEREPGTDHRVTNALK